MQKRHYAVAVLLTALLALPFAALAHEGHVHTVMGTVSALQGSNVELKAPDGKLVTVVLNDKTTFMRGKEKVDRSAVKVGVRAVVELASEQDMTAVVVTLAAPMPSTATR